MANAISPLQAINEKELALKHRVEAAQQQAEARMQAAREAARQRMAEADQAGQAEAEALYQQGVDEARGEAEAITFSARKKAENLRSQATARMDDAAERIVALVLPATSPIRNRPPKTLAPRDISQSEAKFESVTELASLNGESSDHRHQAVPTSNDSTPASIGRGLD